MAKRRQKFGPRFKLEAVMEALQGEKTRARSAGNGTSPDVVLSGQHVQIANKRVRKSIHITNTIPMICPAWVSGVSFSQRSAFARS